MSGSGSEFESQGSPREYRDALPRGTARGRGAGQNPGNRYEAVRLHVLGEELDAAAKERPSGAQVGTRVLADRTRSVINPVDVADLHFKWTVNPYRGCEHGCIYCYARPDHERLGLSCGLDFETVIIAKHDAPPLLREELSSPRWRGEGIMLSGVTDPYQPIERELRITRRCLEVFAEFRQAVWIITKNAMVLRDLDVLARLHEHRGVHVAISVTTLDNALAAKMEPRASAPRERLAAIRELSRAGIPVHAMVAPVIPGLNDREIPAILGAVAEAGAASASWIMLRLPHQIKALFLEWLARQFPDRAKHVEGLVRDVRDGALYDSRMFARQRGEGPVAAAIGRTFEVFKKRHGLDKKSPALNTRAFRPPLFGASEPGLFG